MKPPASYRWLAVASPVALLLVWEVLNRVAEEFEHARIWTYVPVLMKRRAYEQLGGRAR